VKRVVIVGGGFGGLYAARALRREPVQVTLLDRRNHHLFQPLLYQVASAALSPGDIASPIRWILRRQKNVEVLLADVISVDPARRVVVLRDGEIAYDYVIVATGAAHAYFGHDQWRKWAPGLKTLEDALEMRRRVLLAYERAEREADPVKRAALLTFIVIGGGPTGVELAGALVEISRQSLARDFRHFNPGSARIILLEAGPSLLAAFPDSLRQAAHEDLRRLGVEVRTGTLVTEVRDGCVEIGQDTIDAETILWAAGVAASPVGASLGVPTDRAGRVIVQPDLTIPGHSDVFVIGDLAAMLGPDGKQLPGVAQVAIQMGRHAAKNILRAVEHQPYRPFVYKNLGNMATIGRASAVADFGRLRLRGYVAWLAWLFVHLMNLVGFRNRVVVLVQWAWAYFSYQRAIRLITDPCADEPRTR
jgi:NADH:quinone reductase (non-electrogenic)